MTMTSNLSQPINDAVHGISVGYVEHKKANNGSEYQSMYPL